jgi:nucleotide-binding universal stress UspA family protein
MKEVPEFYLRKILVPVDFSENSTKALWYAMAFAKQFNASLTILHVAFVLPEFWTAEGSLADKDFLQGEGERRTDLLMREEVLDRGVEATSVILVGDPPDKIVEFARESAMDLIIIAFHGRSGVRRFVMGGTTEKVMRHASCPVLVVQPHEREFVPVATDETAEPQPESKT